MLGAVVIGFATLMLLPLALSWYFHDGLAYVYVWSFVTTLCAGLALWFGLKPLRRELTPRDGVLLVPLTWVVLPVFACLPISIGLAEAGPGIDFMHAYFEATSALTTSGGTALTRLDTLPISLNFWRCFLQWVGGLGVIILAVAVLPMLGVGGTQLLRAEMAGPLKETKLTPRIASTAKGLWTVYGVISIACALAYWVAGMTPLDALMHMFATVSLGGLTPHDASLGYFHSSLIEGTALFFMVVASVNFSLYFICAQRRSLARLLRDPEVKATLVALLGGGLLAAFVLWIKDSYTLADALRYGVFNVVSVATTTGFTTADYDAWPVFVPVFMLLLSGVATSAGSTGGGIKMVRMLILLKQAQREIRRMVHPRAIQPLTIDGQVVGDQVTFSVLAFMLVYGATVIVLSMVLLFTDMDMVSAFSAVLANVHCMGMGLGAVGPGSSYGALSDFQVGVCSLAMLLGRLEMLTFLAVFMPSFWRR